jgi:TRAP-type C4-dicarboxylate transport system substrate-binding protein
VLGALGVARPAGQSGGHEATTLVLAVVATPGGRDTDIAAELARRVDARSGGALRVTVRAVPATRGSAAALERVRSGTAELALAPSESFGAVDVTTLDALRTPFLIGTDELAAQATGPRFSARLLSGLDAPSLEGLGLVPEGLYRPFGFLEALVSRADFAGVTIRAPRAPAIRELLEALGAKVVDLDATGTDTAVYPGFGLDLAGRRAGDAFPENAYTASNVALFPKVDVLVASSAAFRSLTAAQREALRRAAEDVRSAAVAAHRSGVARDAFCKAGGSIVAASAREIGELRTRTRTIATRLARDATTRALVGEISRLGSGAGRSCASKPRNGITEPAADVSSAVRERVVPPPGSFRAAFTAAELRAAGASAAEAELDAGVLTMTFWGPPWHPRFALEWQGADRARCRGDVFWPNGLVELDWYPETPCSGYAAFRWRRAGQDLRITAVGDQPDERWARIFRPRTWRRVDCDAFVAENGIEPGRKRPCPGGAERDALSRKGRDAPSISPDGTLVALETSLPDADGIVIGQRDGSELRWLTHVRRGGSWRLDDAWPVFSPDGRWVAFLRARWRTGKPWGTDGIAVFVIRADGSGLERLTPFTTLTRLPKTMPVPPRDAAVFALERDSARLTWRPVGGADTR